MLRAWRGERGRRVWIYAIPPSEDLETQHVERVADYDRRSQSTGIEQRRSRSAAIVPRSVPRFRAGSRYRARHGQSYKRGLRLLLTPCHPVRSRPSAAPGERVRAATTRVHDRDALSKYGRRFSLILRRTHHDDRVGFVRIILECPRQHGTHRHEPKHARSSPTAPTITRRRK